MFWVYWSSGARKERQGSGYFNCPTCGSRQPGEQFQAIQRTYLYGILPLSGGEPVGPESYRCSTCGREFVADGSYGYDFGEHALPRTWRCFKCNGEIPYERFECPHCGYHFDVSRRL